MSRTKFYETMNAMEFDQVIEQNMTIFFLKNYTKNTKKRFETSVPTSFSARFQKRDISFAMFY